MMNKYSISENMIKRKDTMNCCLDFKIPKKKRTPVVYTNSYGPHELYPRQDSAANTTAPPIDGQQFSEIPANDGQSSTVAVNGDDPDDETENGEDPDGEIVAREASGDGAAAAEMPAEMREVIIGRMGGYMVQDIIVKKMTETDMNTGQGRLVLTSKKVKVKFLTAAEEEYLEYRGGGLNYLQTVIVGPDLVERPIQFKKWLLGNSFSGCLTKEWNSFVKAYKIKVGNKVRVWSFRVDKRDHQNDAVISQLCFALLKLTR